MAMQAKGLARLAFHLLTFFSAGRLFAPEASNVRLWKDKQIVHAHTLKVNRYVVNNATNRDRAQLRTLARSARSIEKKGDG